MHRTTHRPLAWGFLIAALLLGIAPTSWAQPEKLPPPVEPKSRSEILGLNQTKRIGMTSKAKIDSVQNENPKVLKVDVDPDDPTKRYVTGLTFGTARLVFTDVNKGFEVVVVRVDDLEQRRQDLADMIRRIAPTANLQIDATSAAGPITVVITGTISDIDTAQRVLEAARAIFTIRLLVEQNKEQIVPPNVVNGMRIIGVQQVQLETVVAVVNRSKLRAMNFSWVVNGQRYILNSVIGGPFNFANTLNTAIGGGSGTLTSNPNITFGVFGNRDSVTGYLGALTTEGLAKIYADSREVTLSGRPGKIVSGGEVPILTSSGQGAPSVSYKQFGSVVNFLPIVQNGKIHLEVRAELSAINQANGITIQGVVPTVIPGFSTRQAEVAVQLEDGQTLAIGGLIQNTVNATIQRVPVMGHIPGLGMFFTNKTYNETEEELLILVTPRLVDGFDCTRIPKYLPGRESRTPDDFELFLEGIMEAPRGPRLLAPYLRDYKGAHTLSPNAGQIPCPPGGAGCVNGPSHGPVSSAVAPTSAMPVAGVPLPTNDLPTAQPLPVGDTNALPAVELPVRATPIPTPALPPVSLDLER